MGLRAIFLSLSLIIQTEKSVQISGKMAIYREILEEMLIDLRNFELYLKIGNVLKRRNSMELMICRILELLSHILSIIILESNNIVFIGAPEVVPFGHKDIIPLLKCVQNACTIHIHLQCNVDNNRGKIRRIDVLVEYSSSSIKIQLEFLYLQAMSPNFKYQNDFKRYKECKIYTGYHVFYQVVPAYVYCNYTVLNPVFGLFATALCKQYPTCNI
ncbi:hypothetical protein PMAC_001197 [Pneumocystis sp. 'macacae']|nr:hypothetical protein PMAC_001197 [Pneumocystis sp. 'macacae']